RQPLSIYELESRCALSRTRLELLLKVLDVDGAVRRERGGWRSTGVAWAYDAARYAAVAARRLDEQQAMRDYVATSGCRMRFLRERLDDPGAADCGRCDNCLGRPMSTTTSAASIELAAQRLERPGVAIEARRQWPAGLDRFAIAVRGTIAADEQHEVGRAIARFSDLGYGPRVRRAVAPEVTDGPVPDVLVKASLKVLRAWRDEWPVRPCGIVTVGSVARPELVESFAARIAAAGKLDVLGTVRHDGPSRVPRSNAVFRLRAIFGAYSVPSELQGLLAGPLAGQPVLLLDDYVDSGWTLVVVARLLRLAGAGAVYPLVLGITG
ncbi:MAG: recombinase RecQ, partial [Acidimicrobiales bacterium]